MKTIRLIIISGLFLFLTGCGTTSSLKPTDSTKGTSGSKESLNLSGYNKVIVLNLEENSASKPFKGGETFSNHIASALEKKKAFSTISRKKDNSHALLVNGKVTNYDKGNAAARMLIGFTAGNSNFDATVNVSDNQTGKKLGTILVDKNSWALGGVMAAVQTVDSLMQSAASKIADELSAARQSKTRKVASQ